MRIKFTVSMSIDSTRITKLNKAGNSKFDRDSDLLAGTVAENLTDGEYVVSAIPQLVIFIRINNWRPEIGIEELDFSDKFIIKLSNGRIVDLHKSLIENSLKNVDHCRIVILSDFGVGRFKVDL